MISNLSNITGIGKRLSITNRAAKSAEDANRRLAFDANFESGNLGSFRKM